jgi:hypothetical protein
MEDIKVIYFYDVESEFVKKEHVFLNNFDPSPISEDGLNYNTVEQYYQAHKFDNFSQHPQFNQIFHDIRYSFIIYIELLLIQDYVKTLLGNLRKNSMRYGRKKNGLMVIKIL